MNLGFNNLLAETGKPLVSGGIRQITIANIIALWACFFRPRTAKMFVNE
jgi:hypothetical protein